MIDINQLGKKFERTRNQNDDSSLDDQIGVSANVRANANRMVDDPLAGKVCQRCDDTRWWCSIYDSVGRCSNCEPMPSGSLVREEYFFDEAGDRWLISFETTDGEEFERWTKMK